MSKLKCTFSKCRDGVEIVVTLVPNTKIYFCGVHWIEFLKDSSQDPMLDLIYKRLTEDN